MNTIIGLGNALVDLLTYLPDEEFLKKHNLPKGSMTLVDRSTAEKLTAESQSFKRILMSGGSAANTIYGLSMMKITCGFAGKVGNDDLGNLFYEDLNKSNIETYLQKSSTPSGRALALITPDGERTFAVYLGAALELSEEDVPTIPFHKYNHLHIEGYLVQNHQLLSQAIRSAKKAGLTTSLDLASFNVVYENIDFLKNEIWASELIDIMFANEEESYAFTGKKPMEALYEIAEHCRIAVVKTGKKGSLIKEDQKVYEIKPFKANAIDTTGAGDMYAAGFLGSLAKGYDTYTSGNIASLIAGKCVEVRGARMPESMWTEIKAFINRM